MSKTTIPWADYTFNPWIGCTKISPGCANCYAETYGRRFGVEWGPGKARRRTSANYWKEPLAWNRHLIRPDGTRRYVELCEPEDRRARVFCGSLCDWLDPEVPAQWLSGVLDLIWRTPKLDWLVLTKRPENWRQRMFAAGESYSRPGLPSNVWLGVTAEDQQRWDERVPILLSIPAAKRFVSVEPMLGPIDMALEDNLVPAEPGPQQKLDWIILGGESGPKARPCNVDWIRDGIWRCRAAGVACFVKQMGSKATAGEGWNYEHTWVHNMRDPKGADPSEWPEDLRVREWP